MATVIEAGTPPAHHDAFLAWLREHEVEPRDTFKVEVSADSMIVHQYARDDEGDHYADDAGDIALRVPFAIELRRPLPPLVYGPGEGPGT